VEPSYAKFKPGIRRRDWQKSVGKSGGVQWRLEVGAGTEDFAGWKGKD